MKIVTHYDPPPIPLRQFDWSATDRDTYEPGQPVGWGRTQEEARADLLAQLEEKMDLDEIRAELARLERRAKSIGSGAFVTMDIWPTGQPCGPFIVNAHLLSLSATADTAAAALAEMARLLDEHDPAKREADGWATLGAIPAPPDAPGEEAAARRDRHA